MVTFEETGMLSCNSIQSPVFGIVNELITDQNWEAGPADLDPTAQITGSDDESAANEIGADRCSGSRNISKRNRKGRTPLAELADEDAMLEVISRVAEITNERKQELSREEYDQIIKEVLEKRSRIMDVKNIEKITVKSVKKKIENTMSKKTMKRLQERRNRADTSVISDNQHKKLERQEKLLKACEVIHKYRSKGKNLDIYLEHHSHSSNAALFIWMKNPRDQKRVMCDPLLSDQTAESPSQESSAGMLTAVDSDKGSLGPNQCSTNSTFPEQQPRLYAQTHVEHPSTSIFPENHDYFSGSLLWQHPAQPDSRPFDLFRTDVDPDCSSNIDISAGNYFLMHKDEANLADSLLANSILNYASVN